ncbi:MAG: rhodanese-like domain-containing protein [Flavobacteriales bacterium]|nr:rhodanese-like domain-containing protein [Flavobacteriales bacterium]
MKELNSLDAFSLLENETLLVDVREKDELAISSYDVKNQINIPLSELEQRFTEIPTDQTVILACRAGARSARAIQFLVQNGFSEELLINLQGGITAWEQNGLKTK